MANICLPSASVPSGKSPLSPELVLILHHRLAPRADNPRAGTRHTTAAVRPLYGAG
jgi:hypothetical protein